MTSSQCENSIVVVAAFYSGRPLIRNVSAASRFETPHGIGNTGELGIYAAGLWPFFTAGALSARSHR